MSGISFVRAYFKDMDEDEFPIELEERLSEIMADYARSQEDDVYTYRTHDGAMSTFRASQLIGLRTFTPESREAVERHRASINAELKLVRHDLGIFDQDDYR